MLINTGNFTLHKFLCGIKLHNRLFENPGINIPQLSNILNKVELCKLKKRISIKLLSKSPNLK
jgi:hypothetical protein